MNSFTPGFIGRQAITQNLLRTIFAIGELKGKEGLFRAQSPQALETLRQAAIIQSTESSNRIEGITAPLERIKALVLHKTTPRDRSEQEIAGYRDVLNTVHGSAAHIPLTTGVVLQFHCDLFQFTADPGGQWKSVNNEIAQLHADGSKTVRFTPTPAHATAEAMETLHERFQTLWQEG